MRWSGLWLVASLLAAGPARAETASDADLTSLARSFTPAGLRSLVVFGRCTDYRWDPPHHCPRVSKLRRAGATALAATTGLVLRGVGSYLVGEKRTAKRLALVGALGLGGIAVGGAPVGVSGGYPPTMPLMPVLLVGAGAFFTSWWADVGVAAGASRIGEARTASPWSLELAMLYLSDPYRQTGLGRLGGTLEIERVQLGASALTDAETELRTGEIDARVRIFGAPSTGAVVSDGSRLIARAAVRGHEDAGDRVKITTGEVELIGRLDLYRLERALHGTFVQMSTGIGVERVSYSGDHDNGSVLLGTFGWGLYLGNRGELSIFYDHRRDSMVGGLAAGRAAGFVGSVGGSIDWLLDRNWATHLEVDVGNAWLTTLAVRYRGGVE